MGALFCAALSGTSACKRRPPTEPSPSATPSAVPAPVPNTPRCSEVKPGASFTLGDKSAQSAAPDAGDTSDDNDDEQADPLSLPFAVELGGAVPLGDGFAVAAITTVAGKSSAVVAVLDADASHGRTVELGKVHGDPDPPELASLGDDLIALVHDTDAGGELLRLVAIKPGPDKIDTVLGAEIASSRDESRVAHLELGPERGVALWDEWNKVDKHGVIRASSFARKDVSNVTRARTISGSNEDAEAPQVVRRPGGFWAAWVSHAVAGKPKPQAAPAVKPAPSASAAPEAPDPNVVELGERWLSVVPLDANGVPSGDVRAVTSKQSHVVVFDLVAAPDGAALLAWRDDDTAPGAEERKVLFARVRPDGSVDRSSIEDDKLGAGAPSLLVDAEPKDPAAPAVWLSLDSVSDATRLGALGPTGNLLDAMNVEPAIRSADTLVLSRGRMLIGRSHGLAMDLSVVTCKAGPAPVPDAGTSD